MVEGEILSMLEGYLKRCQDVKNSRTLETIMFHLNGEVDELQTEVDARIANLPPNEDGIVGEAVDVILCALDLIASSSNISEEEVSQIFDKKYKKWVANYIS